MREPGSIVDLAIIGGGINGCGIARDAAGRGLSVYLCEQGDLGQGTSSASTKLFHGGLRYLEHYEFRLVREALEEREVLLRTMPHISWPLRFVLPHHPGLRPAWLIRLGLFIYDHLGGRKLLPPTRSINFRKDPTGNPLQDRFRRGFEYSDCWIDDARLVVLNARAATDLGAEVAVRTRCLEARRDNGLWFLTLEDTETGARPEIRARGLVNASGPWVEDVIQNRLRHNSAACIRLVKGSHIVVRKLFEHDRAYIFQNADGRIVFAIPYETDYTLVGTTDEDHDGSPEAARCSDAERAYLCSAVSEYLDRPVVDDDIVWTYSGVRPLYDDGATSNTAATRDYRLELEEAGGAAPLLNVFGGKITTYRRLSEAALAKLGPYYAHMTGPWTADVSLPGGDFDIDGVERLTRDLASRYPFLGDDWAGRLIRLYGTLAFDLLGTADSVTDMGTCFGADLTEREIVWLIDQEWARTAEDALWRRTKMGLVLSRQEASELESWLAERLGEVAPANVTGARQASPC